MKVAIIHDWLITYAGSERVLEQILHLYPNADLYSIVDFIPENQRGFILDKPVITSFIQGLPGAKSRYKSYLPLMPLAIEQFDLSSYDLVISSSHAVAKAVLTGPDQLHISYVHSPMRYAWDLQHEYLKQSNLCNGVKGWLVKYLLHRLRKWDVGTSNRVDVFIANSNFIKRRIEKVYRRDSFVIFPPVSVNSFNVEAVKDDYYLTASRMVPYKRIDLIVEAFTKIPHKKLKVIGTGPDHEKIKRIAQGYPNIELMGYQPFTVLKEHMQKAKGFIFAAEEDFGIAPVEAQACGTPVICYGKGGVLDTVIDNESGVFFKRQSVDALISAIEKFETITFDAYKIRNHAQKFSNEIFKKKFKKFVDKSFSTFKGDAS